MSTDLKELRFQGQLSDAIALAYRSGGNQEKLESPLSALDFQSNGVMVERLETAPEGTYRHLTFVPYANIVSIKQTYLGA